MQSNDGRTNSSQQIQRIKRIFCWSVRLRPSSLYLSQFLFTSVTTRARKKYSKNLPWFSSLVTSFYALTGFFSQGAKCPVLTSNYGRSSTVHPICTSQVNAPRDAPFVSQSLNHLWGDSNQLHLCAPGKFNETVILWLTTFSQRKCLTMHDILSAVRPFNVLSTRCKSKSIPFNVYGSF